MTTKALKLAQEILEEFSNKETTSYGAVSWALINKDCATAKSPGTACFADMAHSEGGAKYLAFWNFNKRKFPRQSDSKEEKLTKSERDFIRYIVRDSVFATCFHTKSIKKIYNKGTIIKTHMPAQFVYSAATSIRYVSEYPDIPFFWNKFRKYITDDEAYILAHLYQQKSGGEEKYISNPFWSSQHKWPVGPNLFGKDEFKRFCDRDLSGLEGRPPFSEDTNFRGVAEIWRGPKKKKNEYWENISKQKQLTWTGGVKRIESHWSRVPYLEYEHTNIERDVKAALEINRA